MLKVDSLSVSYGDFRALTSVDLEVNEGEVVALIGSNGAGKTTTINSISGITNVKKGSVSFMGSDITDRPAYQRVQDGIIQVPEGRRLFPGMTVMDNLIIGSYTPGARAKRQENLEMVMEMFPKLYDRRAQLAGSLSGGEQQMVAIARGLMACPRVLMMDEPSLGLAPVIVSQIFDIIKKINQQGVAILLVEQNVVASLEIADRAYVIVTGRTVLSGTSRELAASETLRDTYLGL